MCHCHWHLAISHSTTWPRDFIAGQMGILLQGEADWQEGDVVWVAQDTRESAKALMGTPATVHMEAASMWVHVMIYLYLQWSPLNRGLSNSKDINQWLIWNVQICRSFSRAYPGGPAWWKNRHFLTTICIQVPEWNALDSAFYNLKQQDDEQST